MKHLQWFDWAIFGVAVVAVIFIMLMTQPKPEAKLSPPVIRTYMAEHRTPQ